jgi:DUF1680 family protein
MYVTGGIGSSRVNEGFSGDYDLPNLEAYCETCASVGMVLWNQRMNRLTGDAKYVDVLERSLYNGALAGVSLEGDRFFYVNPLASNGNHHRRAWYGTACCPSNISRFLPSIGSYIYGTSADAIWVNLYIGNKASFSVDGKDIELEQQTGYPWNGSVVLTVSTPSRLKKEIRLRIPAWCGQYTVSVNGVEKKAPEENGYAVLAGRWRQGDRIVLEMAMPVEVVAADPLVEANVGKRAIQRGPLVYCMEEIDNPDDFDALGISPATTFTDKFEPSLLNGVVSIRATENGRAMSFVPYYAWDNRSAGKMKVWVDYKE